MHYYYLRLLTLLQKALGFIMSKAAQAYNYFSTILRKGIKKEVHRVESIRDDRVAKANKAIITAKLYVKVAAQDAKDLEIKENDIVFNKLTKLATKVGI